jgi:TolB-like protein/tRNA A-37 threonylcarbamoyl transferase component Bud32
MRFACPNRQELANYLHGRLSAEELESIASHVDACPTCGSTLEHLESATDPLIDELQRPVTGAAYEAEPQLDEALVRLHQLQGSSQVLAAQAEPLAPGTMIGVYRIEQLLGQGGMGLVYRARHTQLDRPVALKLLRSERQQRPEAIARFQREMKAVGRLNHPHLVTAHDAGEHAGVRYLAMEYVAGLNLSQVAARAGRLPVAAACAVIRQAAEGLDYACAQGVVHRDVKPSNLILTAAGVVKVLDLGLARLLDREPAEEITETGHMVGTLDYMAPEQIEDCRQSDARVDVYGLGATLFKLLTGRTPFSGDQRAAPARLLAILHDPAPRLDRLCPEIPPALARLVDAMLAKQPDARPATPGEVAARLTPFVAGADLQALYAQAETGHQPAAGCSAAAASPSRARRLGWRLLAVAGAVLFLVAGTSVGRWWSVQRADDQRPPLAPSIAPVIPTAHQERAVVAPQRVTSQSMAPQPVPKLFAQKTPTARPPVVCPIAVLPFQDRSADMKAAAQLTDVLTARLGTLPGICLVERAELERMLTEQRLNLSGAIAPAEALRIGQFTGAKLLVTGSVAQLDKSVFLLAKLIGTETGRVLTASVAGSVSDDLAGLAEKLATQVGTTLSERAGELVPPPTPRSDRRAAVGKQLGAARRPTLWIHVAERHVGQPVIDPAAQTELTLYARQAEFPVIDSVAGNRKLADVFLEGEAFSELAGRLGDLVSVKARVELKAVERNSGRVLVADRQTAVVVDLAEQIAGKAALQEAAAALAERVLPQLVH